MSARGAPPRKAGLKGGDIIVGFGGKPVATIYDYTESLGRYKPGDTVEVVVKRDGKDVTLKVTLGRSPNDPHRTDSPPDPREADVIDQVHGRRPWALLLGLALSTIAPGCARR